MSIAEFASLHPWWMLVYILAFGGVVRVTVNRSKS